MAWMKEPHFFMLAAVPYYETKEHEFVPAEMALVEFSLEEGIGPVSLVWNIAHGKYPATEHFFSPSVDLEH